MTIPGNTTASVWFDSDATVRGRLQRHVVGTVDGDAVVEVDRVHHPAQRADTLALVAPGEAEDAARRLGVGALVLWTGSGNGSPLASVS